MERCGHVQWICDSFTFALFLCPKGRTVRIGLHICISSMQLEKKWKAIFYHSFLSMFLYRGRRADLPHSRHAALSACKSTLSTLAGNHSRSSKYCYVVSSLSRHLCFPDFWPGTQPGVPKCCGEASCHDISNPTRSAGNVPRKLAFIGSQKACICQICLSRPNPAFLKFISH